MMDHKWININTSSMIINSSSTKWVKLSIYVDLDPQN